MLAPTGIVVQTALGIEPETAQGIYLTLLINFSLPAWAYFTWGDISARGATIGKRLFAITTRAPGARRIDPSRALGRTGIKMIPWELTHASVFLFAPALGTFDLLNWIGLGFAYALIFLYLGVAWRTGGRKSVHDLVVGTEIRLAKQHRAVGIGSEPH